MSKPEVDMTSYAQGYTHGLAYGRHAARLQADDDAPRFDDMERMVCDLVDAPHRKKILHEIAKLYDALGNPWPLRSTAAFVEHEEQRKMEREAASSKETQSQ